MKTPTFRLDSIRACLALIAMLILSLVAVQPSRAYASGGSGSGGGVKVDTIKVSKCFYDAPSGQMLIKASSSDPSAHLYAYLSSGTYLGEVQNGGGSRYGGTVMGYVPVNPVTVLMVSSSGGRTTAPTTPFQP